MVQLSKIPEAMDIGSTWASLVPTLSDAGNTMTAEYYTGEDLSAWDYVFREWEKTGEYTNYSLDNSDTLVYATTYTVPYWYRILAKFDWFINTVEITDTGSGVNARVIIKTDVWKIMSQIFKSLYYIVIRGKKYYIAVNSFTTLILIGMPTRSRVGVPPSKGIAHENRK
jgi:hypothetical protein